MRAGLGPTPACQALANIVWSISSGLIPDRLIVSPTITAPNSGAVNGAKEPPNFPPAVRPAPNITTSLIIPPNYFPSGNGPFSDERRSPRAYFLDVLSVRLVVNPCAVLLIEKIAHFQIGN
jgi:hypothetical protein